MKLLYINKINTNTGWGLETFINQSLIEREVKTICVDYQESSYALAKTITEIKDDFDAVLVERGCGYLIPLCVLKAIQRPRFLLFTELVERNPDQHYMLSSGLFDHVFLRSIPCMQWVKRQGWLQSDQMSLFLSAIDPSFHRHVPTIQRDIDILFVGNLLPRRRKYLDELSKYFSITTCNIYGEEMVQLFNRAKIILNIHGTDLLDTETRVYETLACKGFLITERLSAESQFQDKTHLIETSSLSEMKQKIAYYLDHSYERLEIANAGYSEVIKEHTFSNRTKQLHATIEKYVAETNEIDLSPLNRGALRVCTGYENVTKVFDVTNSTVRSNLSLLKRKLVSHLSKS